MIQSRRSRLPRTTLRSVVLALVLAGTPATSAAPRSCFQGDYPPGPAPRLDYRKALAAGVAAPARLLVGGRRLGAGSTLAQINAALGHRSSLVEDWKQRSLEAQCHYTVEVHRRNPGSMNEYRWMSLRAMKLAGLFEIREWELAGVARVRAFLHWRGGDAGAKAWLFHVILPAVAVATVPYHYRPTLHVVREGPPRVVWDLATDTLTLPAPGAGVAPASEPPAGESSTRESPTTESR